MAKLRLRLGLLLTLSLAVGLTWPFEAGAANQIRSTALCPAVKGRPPIITILPLQNASGRPDLAWLSIGLQDSLTVDLWYVAALGTGTLAGMNYWEDLRDHCPTLDMTCLADLTIEDWRVLTAHSYLDGVFWGAFRLEGERVALDLAFYSLPDWVNRGEMSLTAPLPDLEAQASRRIINFLIKQGVGVSQIEAGRAQSSKTKSLEAWRLNAHGFLDQHRFTLAPAAQRDAMAGAWRNHLEQAVQADPRYAEAWNNLGWYWIVQKNWAAGAQAFSEALARKPDLVDANMGLGECRLEQGDPEGARPYLQRGFDLNRSLYGHMNYTVKYYQQIGRHQEGLEWLARQAVFYQAQNNLAGLAAAWSQRGKMLEAMKQNQAAAAAFQQAIDFAAAGFGPTHQQVSRHVNQLANFFFRQKDYDQAASLFQRALSIDEARYGPDHAQVLINLGNLIQSYWELKSYAQAEPLMRRVLSLRTRVYGPISQEVALTLSSLANLYDKTGQIEKAADTYEKALPVWEALKGPEDVEVATVLYFLGPLQMRLNKFEAAIANMERAAAILEKTDGPESAAVTILLVRLAEAFERLRQWPQAVTMMERAVALLQKGLGENDPILPAKLDHLGRLYLANGEIGKAKSIYERLVTLYERLYGPEELEVARALHDLATVAIQLGETENVVEWLERSLAISQKALGEDDPEVADVRRSLADYWRQQGDCLQAAPLYEQVLAVMEKDKKPERLGLAAVASRLAACHYQLGAYASAEPLYQKAIDIYQQDLGPEHPFLASVLAGLGQIYTKLGRFAAADPLFSRAVAIQEKAYGPDHSQLAATLNNQASLCFETGDYGRAEKLFLRSLAIQEKAKGPEHPDVTPNLINLAMIYNTQGDSRRAEPLYRRALAILEQAHGPDHPAVAAVLNNLAHFYQALGDNERAEPLYKRALAIREKALGPEHPDTAASLGNLAGLYHLRDPEQALDLYQRALSIERKVYGPEHPIVAGTLENIAVLCLRNADYDLAGPLFQEALTIREKALGPEHPETAAGLMSLTALAFLQADYVQAETHNDRAVAIVEKTLGPDDPRLALYLYPRAWTRAVTGRLDQAYDDLNRALTIDDRLIGNVLGVTTEEQQIRFLARHRWRIDHFLGLVSRQRRHDPAATLAAFNLWVRRKGLILEAQKRFQEALIYTADQEAVAVFRELNRVRALLSRLTFAAPDQKDSGQAARMTAELEAQKKKLEARLSQLSQAYARRQRIVEADAAKLSQALPPQTALMELARIKASDFVAPDFTRQEPLTRYLAFILKGGDDQVALIDLGPAEIIDQAVNELKKAITDLEDMKGLKSGPAARRLHDLVFAPLIPTLGGIKELFISPDGNLNLVPFEVLRGEDGRDLIEDYSFNYLAAGRDLLGFGQSPSALGRIVLLGDPAFDLEQEQKAVALNRLGLTPEQTREEDLSEDDLRGMKFDPLPGTREEVQSIAAVLGLEQVEVFTGVEAMEEVLRSRIAPRLLHLATHGFFLTDRQFGRLIEPNPALASLPFLQTSKEKGPATYNPLLRSGLALAGANAAIKGETAGAGGLLTAEKILGLRLAGTELVVLSACKTGLGEVMIGEGVFGLRRALLQAGAKSLVMSMWSVPDQETKELMIEFYRSWVNQGLSRNKALRQAALKQRQIVQTRYGYAHPFFWGAFVFLGEP
ncbi:MAG: tetratricopeptide repeat protein [Thermodesulfobacteriota bacterium]